MRLHSMAVLPRPTPISRRARDSASFHVRRWLQRSPRVTVDATGAYSCRVRLQGAFLPGWAGNLTAGLAELGINVHRAHAVGSATGVWAGEFEVERTPTAVLLTELDFARLADRDRRTPVDLPLAITFARAELVADHDGSLLVEVEGNDRIGFLAALLDRFAFLSLFPAEFHASTVGRTVSDRFWLMSAGRRRPDASLALVISRHFSRLRDQATT